MALFCALCIAGTAYLAYRHVSLKRHITQQAQQHLQELTQVSASHIDEMLRDAVTVAEAVAADLSAGKLPAQEEQLKRSIETTLQAHPNFFGMAIAFQPQAYRPGLRLFAPYAKRKGDALVFQPLESRYDYTGHGWFAEPIQQGRSRWAEPYFGQVGGTLMTSYSAVFYRNDTASGSRVPAGVVAIDIALDEIKHILESLDLGPSGFAALTSSRGTYLYHPNNDYVVEQKNLLEVAHERGDKDRLWLGQQLKKPGPHSGIMEHVSTTTGQSAWLAYESVGTTGWTLENTFIRGDVPINVEVLRRQLVWITCLAIVSMLSLLLVLAGKRRDQLGQLWLASGAASAVLIAGIGVLWYLALFYKESTAEQGVAILDKVTLSQVQKDYSAGSERFRIAPPIYLATGLFIDTLRFGSDGGALITGYLWQKYPDTLPQELSRAIAIPSAAEVRLSEPVHFRGKGMEVLRWEFQARLTPRMSHTGYPLERETISLQILPRDLEHNVVLVPDIPAYKLLNPTSRPGLEKQMELPGWSIEKTFFAMAQKEYQADFRPGQSILQEKFPLLSYHIVVQRNFIDAFISNLTPIICTACMLFLLLAAISSDKRWLEKPQADSGFAITALTMSSGLFLVVVFAHLGVREKIQAQEIFYLEYFYFVIYLAIIGVSLLPLWYNASRIPPFLRQRQLPLLAYWPILLGSLFAVTLAVFY